jgi:hypothetical protein
MSPVNEGVREIALSNQELREVYSETKCCFYRKKKVEKFCSEVGIPSMVYVKATSVLEECGCWVATHHLYGK